MSRAPRYRQADSVNIAPVDGDVVIELWDKGKPFASVTVTGAAALALTDKILDAAYGREDTIMRQ